MSGRAIRTGLLASVGLSLFYVLVVAGASGSWDHLGQQARQDWYYLVAIVSGFGMQVAMVSELRRRHRLHRQAAVAGGAGAGASTAGMVACCAHHLADVAPFIGATGAAAFLTDHRVAFMVVGVAVNALGVAVSGWRLRRVSAPTAHDREDAGTCLAA